MAAPAKSTPRDAQVMAAILKDMGVLDYEPRLINQMLEFTYRYVTDILDDAKIYSTHANKKNLDSDDVKLAIQCKMDHSFTTPPPRDLLMEIARHKNSQQLPLIKPYSLPRLPPDRCCLSAPNYKLKTLKKPRIQIGLSQFSGGPQRISLAPMQSKSSSGHSLAVVSKSQPTVTIIKPGTTSVPKPQIRVNTGIPKVVTHTSGSMSSQPGLGPSIQTRPIPSSSIYPHSGQHGGQSSSQSISHTGHAISHSGQTLSHSAQSISHTGQPASLGGQFLLQGAINPLKRKLEDDDYDK